MAKLKFPSLLLIALLVGVGVLILTIALQPIATDEDPHNHFIGSGTLDFAGTAIEDTFGYKNILDTISEAYDSIDQCIILSKIADENTLHFHHNFNLKLNCDTSFPGPTEIETMLFINEIKVNSSSNANVSIAKGKNSNFFESVINPNKNIIIKESDWEIAPGPDQQGTCSIEMKIDIDIPLTEVTSQYFVPLHLVFQIVTENGFHTHALNYSNCNTALNCSNFSQNEYEYYYCHESSECFIMDDLALFKLEPICGPFPPAN